MQHGLVLNHPLVLAHPILSTPTLSLEMTVLSFFIQKNRESVPVNIVNLGAAVEASISSPNAKLYGSVGIHNNGHVLIAQVTDPDGRYQQVREGCPNKMLTIFGRYFLQLFKTKQNMIIFLWLSKIGSRLLLAD